MNTKNRFEIFLVAAPGTEESLYAEAKLLKFNNAKLVAGGATIEGTWQDVWRANLELREAVRVLARIGSFHAGHLAQLDKLARKFPWSDYLRPDVPVHVDVTSKKSRIYHAGAAAQRIATAIKEELGATIADDADVVVKARFENNLCTISIDTTGESLHKRGHKEAVGKAPLRETLASYFLRQCGYDGHEPVVDPMCGSGTFLIEAAEISMGFKPGRSRSFAFENLTGFDLQAWTALKANETGHATAQRFHGSDRDAGAIAMSKANAVRAGVGEVCHFQKRTVSDFSPPDGPKGLVIVNPPYGTRIGDKKPLLDLYAALGKTLADRFNGWRVGLITTDKTLAAATKLPIRNPKGSINHGGLRVFLFQTEILN